MAERPFFDPDRIRRDAPGGDSGRGALLRVRQVNELVAGAISRHLPATLHVVGEVGDLSRPASGHLYLTLKDAGAELRCVMWRSAAGKLRFNLDSGMEVIATGAIEAYVPRGTYQLIVRRIEPRGVGALELAFRQIRERLEREGLLDPHRKRPLPQLPRTIAVVTSPSGAVLHDIIQTLQRRYPAVTVLLFPVRVQGEGAAAEIAAAIGQMNAHAASLGGIDVAIVGRGGGSLEDLWAFNEEVVARAIAASAIPIISAVGHEVDVTISDLVADQRAATPTAAAELATPRLDVLRESLEQAALRTRRALRGRLDLAAAQMQRLEAAECLARPTARLLRAAQGVDELAHRLRAAPVECLRRARERLRAAEPAALRAAADARMARGARRLSQLGLRLERGWRRCGLQIERRLSAAMMRLRSADGRVQHGRAVERLAQLLRRAQTAALAALSRRKQEVAAKVEAAAACDPRRVLARGYSVTRDARSGAVIRAAGEIREGQLIETEVATGRFRSVAHDPQQGRLFD